MISYTTFSFFILYFGITFLLYCLVPKRVKWCVLLLGSCVFYFISAKGHIFSLIINVIVIWIVGLGLQMIDNKAQSKTRYSTKDEKKKIKTVYLKYKKLLLSLGITITVSLLIVSKYSNFFIDNANKICNLNLNYIQIVQPLGISFFTLESISYITDVYRGSVKAEKNPLRVLLFLSFFLTVVEGPISKYTQLSSQLDKGISVNYENLSKGFLLAIWGLFKKVVIADRAVILVNNVFDSYKNHTGIAIAAGVVFYTIQLYCDFSGIMDVVCGLGQMMGLALASNFKRPFFSKTIQEFWQRWHITLGSWLRDYIFLPLSLSEPIKQASRISKNIRYPGFSKLYILFIPLFFVWLLNGFWHGAEWKYVIYGLYYFLLMLTGIVFEPSIEKICKKIKLNRQAKPYQLFQIIKTIIIVNIGMLIFRADSIKTAFEMLVIMITKIDLAALIPGYKNGFNLLPYDYTAIVLGSILLFLVSYIEEKGIDIKDKIFHLPYIIKTIIYMSLLLIIVVFGAYGEEYGVGDLIYANF